MGFAERREIDPLGELLIQQRFRFRVAPPNARDQFLVGQEFHAGSHTGGNCTGIVEKPEREAPPKRKSRKSQNRLIQPATGLHYLPKPKRWRTAGAGRE